MGINVEGRFRGATVKMLMKRKILSDIECMSGTGWMPDSADFEIECPECGEILEEKKNLFVCDNGHKFKIERGVQYMVRIGDKIQSKCQLSKACKKCTSTDCGDYDNCKHGHNYIGKSQSIKKKAKKMAETTMSLKDVSDKDLRRKK